MQVWVSEAINSVIINHADGLHIGIAQRGADKSKAVIFKVRAKAY